MQFFKELNFITASQGPFPGFPPGAFPGTFPGTIGPTTFGGIVGGTGPGGQPRATTFGGTTTFGGGI